MWLGFLQFNSVLYDCFLYSVISLYSMSVFSLLSVFIARPRFTDIKLQLSLNKRGKCTFGA